MNEELLKTVQKASQGQPDWLQKKRSLAIMLQKRFPLANQQQAWLAKWQEPELVTNDESSLLNHDGDDFVALPINMAVQKYPELLQENLMEKAVRWQDNQLNALHLALMDTGQFIYVPDETKLEKPLKVGLVTRSNNPHNLIIVGAGAGNTINTALLVASEPDFVICSADIEAQVKAAELLKDAGIPAAVFKVESFKDYLSMLKICTDITGCSELFEKNGTDVERNIKSILESVKNNKFEKNILFIRAGSSDSSTKAKKADDHFAAAMLEELGAYNIADNAPILLDGLSIEEILREDPDFIFISTMGNEQAAIEHMDSILQTPAWKSLSAIKNGKYAYLPKELFQFKPNARWDEAYEYLIGLLYD